MKIYILDDHLLFSEGLEKILRDLIPEVELEKYKSISEINSANPNYQSCDLLICDIELPRENIFKYFSHIKSTNPSLPILVVTMHNKLSVIKKCKRLQIDGYILKDDHDQISVAVKSLLSGENYYCDTVENTLDLEAKEAKFLTPKEEEVVALLVKGKNNQEIADELFISFNTVRTHRKNIRNKLNVSTTGELIRYYFENYVP